MSNRRRSAAYTVLALTIGLFAVSSMLSFSRIERQKNELSLDRSSVLLLITSLEIEYLNFLSELTRYRLQPTPATKAAAIHRLDLVWSRVPLLVEGREGAPLRQLDGFDEVIERTRNVLTRTEAILGQSSLEPVGMDAMLEEMADTRKAMHQFLLNVYLQEELRGDKTQARMRTLQGGLYISFLGMLLSGAVLVGFLLRQIRTGRELLLTAKEALQRAETQTLALQEEMADRIRAEGALRHSERRFKDFAETAADWFWEMGPDLRFSYLSDRFQEVMGLPRREMIGRSLADLYAGQEEDLERWRNHTEDLAAHRSFADFEIHWHRLDGGLRFLSFSGRPVFDQSGRFEGYRGIAHDVTDAKRLAEQMAHQASHDALTGLVNRREFEHRLERVLSTCKEQGSSHALCYLDLDRFKVVNDTCGHAAGDELLKQLAGVLGDAIRRRDTLGRLGGDEFSVLMEHCTLDQASRVADTLRKVVEDFRFVSDGKSFSLSVSIGLVPVDANSGSLTAVLTAADSACYAAKDEGRNRVHVYRANDEQSDRRRGDMQWVSHIQHALDSDRLVLMAQDIRPLSAELRGDDFEVLLRIVNEDGEFVLPGAFLPAAERYHLAPRLDRWVIRNALEWLAEWGIDNDNPSRCFINLSGQSLGDAQIHDFIVEQFRRSGVPYGSVCFEVTETAAISNMTSAMRLFQDLRNRGCRFALDDFGSGLPSFGYLRMLPVDFLKIDGLVVKDIVSDPVDLAMVRSINEIGQLLGKKTIAEFVENERVLTMLRELGVDFGQGFHFGQPEPLAERSPLLRNCAS